MASEAHPLVPGFDFSFLILKILSKILGRCIGLEAYVDIRTFFNVISKYGATIKRRFQINIFDLKEIYAHG